MLGNCVKDTTGTTWVTVLAARIGDAAEVEMAEEDKGPKRGLPEGEGWAVNGGVPGRLKK